MSRQIEAFFALSDLLASAVVALIEQGDVIGAVILRRLDRLSAELLPAPEGVVLRQNYLGLQYLASEHKGDHTRAACFAREALATTEIGSPVYHVCLAQLVSALLNGGDVAEAMDLLAEAIARAIATGTEFTDIANLLGLVRKNAASPEAFARIAADLDALAQSLGVPRNDDALVFIESLESAARGRGA